MKIKEAILNLKLCKLNLLNYKNNTNDNSYETEEMKTYDAPKVRKIK